jgi:hypothetical protein
MANLQDVDRLRQKLRGLEKRYSDEPKPTVVVGYVANYAVFVHERQAKHAPGKQWKFLEQPARELQSTIGEIVATTVAKGGKVIQGLLLAGLRLQRESQQLVPIDTGNLRGSAFTCKEEDLVKVLMQREEKLLGRQKSQAEKRIERHKKRQEKILKRRSSKEKSALLKSIKRAEVRQRLRLKKALAKKRQLVALQKAKTIKAKKIAVAKAKAAKEKVRTVKAKAKAFKERSKIKAGINKEKLKLKKVRAKAKKRIGKAVKKYTKPKVKKARRTKTGKRRAR